MKSDKRQAIGFVVGAVVMLTAACGSTSEGGRVASVRTDSPVASTSEAPHDATQQVLDTYIAAMTKVVECYRKNGLPDVADPDQFGQVLVDTRNLTGPSALHQARTACAPLQVPMPPEVRALLASDEAARLTDEQRATNKKYAECMQANGAPDFPDPLPSGVQDESASWDQTSAGGQRALAACAEIVGAPVASGPGIG